MTATDEKGSVETLTDAINGDDKELDDEIPGASFALVGLTYPIILVVVLLGLAILYWITK